jgi:hypothetical protein
LTKLKNVASSDVAVEWFGLDTVQLKQRVAGYSCNLENRLILSKKG